MDKKGNLALAHYYADKGETSAIENGYASTCAQIASAYAMIAIAEELQSIKSVMMDYVEEKCPVEYRRQ